MGGVWCKSDKGQHRSYTTRGHFNSTLSRWTDHVRQAYRKPKTHHRPARPPQKPMRSNGRLTIGHPQLRKEESSDGWRTATLMVAEVAPIPPPRKKRKHNQDLTRTAFSMDDLNRPESLNNSTISLPEKYHTEGVLSSRSSSSTIVVTPILETRQNHVTDDVDAKEDDDKENIMTHLEHKIEEEEEDYNDSALDADEIVPIEKETMFSSKTLLQSNLGYIDKLSAISEVSAESGFDDRTDVAKSSERSESVTSGECVPQESELNILAHIHSINNVSQLNEINKETKEKTALSKKEWLQNILQEETDPYFISRDTAREARRGSDSLTSSEKSEDISGQPNSLPTDHLHLMNRERETSASDNSANKTPPPTPERRPSHVPCDTTTANHSVLLELLKKNRLTDEDFVGSNPFVHKEESIFLTDTKTNIIYKSLSSDKLTDDYEIEYLSASDTENPQGNTSLNKSKEEGLKSALASERNCTVDSSNPFNDPTSKPHLSDYSFQTPKLVESDAGLNSLLEEKRSNMVSSFDFKEIIKSQNYITALKDLQLTGVNSSTESNPSIVINGINEDYPHSVEASKKIDVKNVKDGDHNLDVKDQLGNKDSLASSRRSSITDSLHEFELSIYDMLKESRKSRESSDEEDSLKIVKSETTKRQ
uniref:Uncharacterized protein n=1 Tax=Graphocephala atropunctata TaxID=36148 RepID=A0A1B6LAS1_9HEMI